MEIKKNEKFDLERRRPFFFGIGMIIALSLAITAFEWRTEVEPICTFNPIIEPTDPFLPPITFNSTPPPKEIIIEEVKDSKEIEDPPEIIWDSPAEDPVVILIPTTPEAIVDDAPRSYVEVMPSYEGGIKTFYKFMNENIKYPKTAQRIGVEGRVFVQFIVEKDGALTDIRIIKGIGADCDEEALRVMKLISAFTPGKQGDVRVPVKMIIPINFTIQ